jgi:hypothetical protein
MDEVFALKASLASLLDFMAENGHGLGRHTNCQPCLDADRAYKLIGVECEYFVPTVALIPIGNSVAA